MKCPTCYRDLSLSPLAEMHPQAVKLFLKEDSKSVQKRVAHGFIAFQSYLD